MQLTIQLGWLDAYCQRKILDAILESSGARRQLVNWFLLHPEDANLSRDLLLDRLVDETLDRPVDYVQGYEIDPPFTIGDDGPRRGFSRRTPELSYERDVGSIGADSPVASEEGGR